MEKCYLFYFGWTLKPSIVCSYVRICIDSSLHYCVTFNCASFADEASMCHKKCLCSLYCYKNIIRVCADTFCDLEHVTLSVIPL